MSKMRKTFKLLNFHRVTVHLQGAIQLDNIEMVFIICFVRFIILINSLISMHPNFDHPIICSKNWSTVKLQRTNFENRSYWRIDVLNHTTIYHGIAPMVRSLSTILLMKYVQKQNNRRYCFCLLESRLMVALYWSSNRQCILFCMCYKPIDNSVVCCFAVRFQCDHILR